MNKKYYRDTVICVGCRPLQQTGHPVKSTEYQNKEIHVDTFWKYRNLSRPDNVSDCLKNKELQERASLQMHHICLAARVPNAGDKGQGEPP